MFHHNFYDASEPPFAGEEYELNKSQRHYNDLYSRLYDAYEELLRAHEDLNDVKQRFEEFGADVKSAAEGGDVDEIRNAIRNLESEVDDFDSALSDIQSSEDEIETYIKTMTKIEVRLKKFRPTMRKAMTKAFEAELRSIDR